MNLCQTRIKMSGISRVIAYYFSRSQIHNPAKIQKTFIGADIGDVSRPIFTPASSSFGHQNMERFPASKTRLCRTLCQNQLLYQSAFYLPLLPLPPHFVIVLTSQPQFTTHPAHRNPRFYTIQLSLDSRLVITVFFLPAANFARKIVCAQTCLYANLFVRKLVCAYAALRFI
jgi:hypothetical protein